MTKTYITSIGIANPLYKISQMQTAAFMAKALHLNSEEQRKLNILYKATHIHHRYSVLEDYTRTENFVFYPNENGNFPSTAQRMKVYEENACKLALAAIQNCLEFNQNFINKITHLITVSCTGMYAPGLDIEIIEALDLNPSIQRFSINFMGCYAAFNALKMADAICRSDKNAKVLVVGVELCTLHLQKSTTDDDLISNAIFADGAAAVLLDSQQNSSKSLSLDAFYCDLAPRGKKDMAWHIKDFGFEMRLSTYIPELLQKNIKELVNKLLDKLKIKLIDVEWFALHPGGRKILETLEKSLNISKEKNASAYDILRNYGNMSSVTVLFVLKKLMEEIQAVNHGQKILSMAFGPGLTLESALLGIHSQ